MLVLEPLRLLEDGLSLWHSFVCRCCAIGGIRWPVCEIASDGTVLARALDGACSGCELLAEANSGMLVWTYVEFEFVGHGPRSYC